MKKFLSILLALAVGFTFTFGSAMSAFAVAAPTPDKQLTEAKIVSEINKAYENAQKELNANKEEALKDIFGLTDTKITFDSGAVVTKDAVEAVYNEEEYNTAKKGLDTQYKAMKETVEQGLKNEVAGFYITTTKSENGTISAADADGNKYMAVYVTFTDIPGKDAYTELFAKNVSGSNVTIAAASKKIKEVVKEQADLDLEKKVGELKAINTAEYSSKVYDATKGAKTHSDLAAELVTKAIAEAKGVNLATAADEPALVAYQTTLKAIYTPAKNNADPTGTIVTGYNLGTPYNTIGLKDLLKVADEMTEAQKLAWAKNTALTKITGDIEDAKAEELKKLNDNIFNENMKKNPDSSKIKAWNEDIETVKDQAAAAIDVVTYLISNEDDYTKLVKANPDPGKTKFTDQIGTIVLDKTATSFDEYKFTFGMNYTMKKCGEIVAKIADLKEKAEVLKKTITIDGVTAADIDNALKEAIDDAYRTGTGEISFADAAKLLHNRQDQLIYAEKVTVKDVKYDGVEKWYNKINLANYDKKYVKELKAVIAETEAAIEAAETADAADAAFLAGLEKFNAVPKKADRTKAQLDKEFSTLLAQYKSDIAAYVSYKVTSLANAKLTDKYEWTPDTLTAKLKEELEASYTVDELKANFTAAKTFVDELKTSAELKEAAAALEKRIAELPKTAAVENREAVNTLLKDIESHNDYCVKIGNALNTVSSAAATKAVNDIKALEDKAVQEQYKALYKDGKITADERDAVKALREAYDAFAEYYTAPDAYLFVTPNVDIDKAEGDLSLALAKKFNDMVAVLPADGSDLAGIKAAREFYNSLDKHTQYDYIYQGKMYDKLADLEKLTVLDAKAYVQDLSIAVRTAKVGKKVKVTVKADVQTLIDNGYTVTYKFYKSTKKGSGYKNTVNKTTNTYTNTNPVKGKNYYKVKLVVKNADGTVVATTPLTQCKYGVRTIK